MSRKQNYLFIRKKEVNGKIIKEYIGLDNEEAIYELAKEFGFEQVKIIQGAIMVKTTIGWWNISVNNDNTIEDVYHENFYRKLSKSEQFLTGFHKQKLDDIHKRKLPSIFSYIIRHDKNHLKCLKSVSRIDKLFKRIEEEIGD